MLVVTKSSDCPQDTTGVVSPESAVATVNVSLGDVLQRFKLPIGTYTYELFYKGSNCSVNVYIKGKIYNGLALTFCSDIQHPNTVVMNRHNKQYLKLLTAQPNKQLLTALKKDFLTHKLNVFKLQK